jgi:hypothetical protein
MPFQTLIPLVSCPRSRPQLVSTSTKLASSPPAAISFLLVLVFALMVMAVPPVVSIGSTGLGPDAITKSGNQKTRRAERHQKRVLHPRSGDGCEEAHAGRS